MVRCATCSTILVCRRSRPCSPRAAAVPAVPTAARSRRRHPRPCRPSRPPSPGRDDRARRRRRAARGRGRSGVARSSAAANIGSAADLLVSDLVFDGLTDVRAGDTEASPAIALGGGANADADVWTFEIDLGPDVRGTASRSRSTTSSSHWTERDVRSL